MTEATTNATQAKTAKHTGPPFGLPNTEIPKIDLSKMEVPAPFRIARTNTNTASSLTPCSRNHSICK